MSSSQLSREETPVIVLRGATLLYQFSGFFYSKNCSLPQGSAVKAAHDQRWHFERGSEPGITQFSRIFSLRNIFKSNTFSHKNKELIFLWILNLFFLTYSSYGCSFIELVLIIISQHLMPEENSVWARFFPVILLYIPKFSKINLKCMM